ncbi:LytR/AlgR family response regulator transcription factor [Bifidobacterium avesanii]|uniref:Response regulator n=1 Tax=Bifidobacterium avesanii TaxID=1798157 RepID=A0A7K3TKD3_9BIFI|nr:LytTR family DNA-binding domain-containing protein [Bifidobacterium avesanii]KAB8288250.1 DNA-binding protein [Bifidobacterium avesanii]NEG78713.1 response regulator [Bifidobacterium avesanii]
MPYRIAVCDDSDVDAAYVRSLVERWAENRSTGNSNRDGNGNASDGVTVETFPSAERFLTRYEERRDFDILLLDIEMGGPGSMDGVELAKAVRRAEDDGHGEDDGTGHAQIVFITGYSDYIAEGYDVEALHYLMKPVNERKLFAVLDRAAQHLHQGGRCLTLQCADGVARVPLETIRYLDVRQNYVTVHAGREYTVKRPLSEFEHDLGPGFFRAGRGLIVNLRRIRRVTRSAVELTDGTALRLPRGAYEPLNRAIIERT